MLRAWGLIAVGVCAAAAAGQTFVYDNFGANWTYNTGTGYTISAGAPIGTDWDQGNSFMPSQSGYVTDVWAAVNHVNGANTMDLWLMDDAGGQPGTILESFKFVGAMVPGGFGGLHPPLHGVALGTTYLDSKNKYWLIASTPGPDSWCAWNYSLADFGDRAARQNMGAWTISQSQKAAFAIAIPEPATLSLLALGLLLRRR